MYLPTKCWYLFSKLRGITYLKSIISIFLNTYKKFCLVITMLGVVSSCCLWDTFTEKCALKIWKCQKYRFNLTSAFNIRLFCIPSQSLSFSPLPPTRVSGFLDWRIGRFLSLSYLKIIIPLQKMLLQLFLYKWPDIKHCQNVNYSSIQICSIFQSLDPTLLSHLL